MKIRVELTDNFKKEAKPLLKKYAYLKSDLFYWKTRCWRNLKWELL